MSRPSILSFLAASLLVLSGIGCGRKGDPNPRPRAAPQACTVKWTQLRHLEIRLPQQDIQGADLIGVEKVRIYYVTAGPVRLTPLEIAAKGDIILERRRPDLPPPGHTLSLDLENVERSAGWIVVVALRVGNVMGVPSEPLIWLDPKIK